MRKYNIVLFSSGVSEKSGILSSLKKVLEEKNYNCEDWRGLFRGANDLNNIAILPMLIKKIPTFDYAILVAEGHDRTLMLRGGEKVEVKTMRDNVLFETGLCAMALGLNRTILLTDDQVYLPDDLTGVGNTLAVKQVIYSPGNPESCRRAGNEVAEYLEKVPLAVGIDWTPSGSDPLSSGTDPAPSGSNLSPSGSSDLTPGMNRAAEEIDEYIHQTRTELTPVVVGAASSTACSYVSNFIFRMLEGWRDGVIFPHESGQKVRQIPLEQVEYHIILPVEYTPETSRRAAAYLKTYDVGLVPSARFRSVEFHYRRENTILHVIDCPTSMVTSYDTAKMILDMNADDIYDRLAGQRFTAKELDLFEATAGSLLSERFIAHTIRHYYSGEPEEKQQDLIDFLKEAVKRVKIERVAY